MGVLYLLLVLLFVVWLKRSLRKNTDSIQKDKDNFWNREREANFVRKKSIDSLDYITISKKSLPFLEINDEIINKCVKELRFLEEEKIVNFSGKSNTDLKFEFGVGNLKYLTQCDDNFIALCRTLNIYSSRLLELNYLKEAKAIMEYAVEIGSDSACIYRNLSSIYAANNDKEHLEYLLFKANQLNSLLKKQIISDLSSHISK